MDKRIKWLINTYDNSQKGLLKKCEIIKNNVDINKNEFWHTLLICQYDCIYVLGASFLNEYVFKNININWPLIALYNDWCVPFIINIDKTERNITLWDSWYDFKMFHSWG